MPFALVIKNLCAHENKPLRSRREAFFLTIKNLRLTCFMRRKPMGINLNNRR
ncbi:hypothetical protein GCWU000325_00100 [Alloprevotella tannerae ATCC 51259]|uniref:Uncharacterized protein n=1 Tax=Alloprevotella tannerae ATCC 51259 TaxID=626522 RepID=C9LD50_9BACT|nr:hypothetical protein GCWU000325_00100 [Alloprevotella tannerae ATCC 51259]